MKSLYVFRASAVIVDLSSFVLPPTSSLKNVAALIMHLEYLIENVSEHTYNEAWPNPFANHDQTHCSPLFKFFKTSILMNSFSARF